MVVTRHSLKNTVTSVSHVHIYPCSTQITRTNSDIFVLGQSLDPVTVRVVWPFVTVLSVWVYEVRNRMLGAILLNESELVWNLIVQTYLWATQHFIGIFYYGWSEIYALFRIMVWVSWMEHVLLTGKKGIQILVMVEGKFVKPWTIWCAVSIKVAGALMRHIYFGDSTIRCS